VHPNDHTEVWRLLEAFVVTWRRDDPEFMERLRARRRPGGGGINDFTDFLHAMEAIPFSKPPQGYYKHLGEYLTLMSRDGCSPEDHEGEYREVITRFYKMCEKASLVVACKLKASIAGVPEADMGRYRGMMLRLVRQALYFQGRRLSLDRSDQDDDPSADDLGLDGADGAAAIPWGGHDPDVEEDGRVDKLLRYLRGLDRKNAEFQRLRIMDAVLLAAVAKRDVPLDTLIFTARRFSLRGEFARADGIMRIALQRPDAEGELSRLLSCLGDSAGFRGLDHARHVSSHAHFLRFLLEWYDVPHGGADPSPSFFEATRKLLVAFASEVGEAEFDRIRIPTLQLLVHLVRGAWGRAGEEDEPLYQKEVFRLQRTLGRALVARKGEEDTRAAVRLLQSLEMAAKGEQAPPGAANDQEMGNLYASLAAGCRRLADLDVRKAGSDKEDRGAQREAALENLQEDILYATEALQLAEDDEGSGTKYRRREFLLKQLKVRIRVADKDPTAAAPERAILDQVEEARECAKTKLFEPSCQALEKLKRLQARGEPNVSEVAVYRQAQHVFQYLLLSDRRAHDMDEWVIRLDRLAGGRPHDVVCAVASALHASCPDFEALHWLYAFFHHLMGELRCAPSPHQDTWFARTLHEVIVAWMEFKVNLAERMMEQAVPMRGLQDGTGGSRGVLRDSQLMCRVQTLLELVYSYLEGVVKFSRTLASAPGRPQFEAHHQDSYCINYPTAAAFDFHHNQPWSLAHKLLDDQLTDWQPQPCEAEDVSQGSKVSGAAATPLPVFGGLPWD
jgi:hypothetical protein